MGADDLGRIWDSAEFKKMLENAIEQLPEQIKFQHYTAKVTRVKYLALIEEGFTEAQALELCKSVFGN